MFNKKHDVRLTEKQIDALRESMSPSERRQFCKEQKKLKRDQDRREDDAFFDGLLFGTLLDDD